MTTMMTRRRKRKTKSERKKGKRKKWLPLESKILIKQKLPTTNFHWLFKLDAVKRNTPPNPLPCLSFWHFQPSPSCVDSKRKLKRSMVLSSPSNHPTFSPLYWSKKAEATELRLWCLPKCWTKFETLHCIAWSDAELSKWLLHGLRPDAVFFISFFLVKVPPYVFA